MASTLTSSQTTETEQQSSHTTPIVLSLFVLSLGCYLNTLANGFVYDDRLQIVQNAYVKSWHYLPQIFTSTVWSFVGDAGATNYYRPLMTLTFLGLWKIFAGLPFGFHLFNILLNALVVASVFYAGRVLLKDDRAASLAALLFAIHPVHSETVNWIAAVPDLEATLFSLLAFIVYVTTPWSRLISQAVVVALFVLAILAKEPALMLAPLLITYEHFVRDRHAASSLVSKTLQYAPVCMAGVLYLGLRIALFGKLAPVLQHPQITWPEAIFSAFALVSQYTKLLFWPEPLSAFHVFHPSQSLLSLSVLAGVAVVVTCVLFILMTYRRLPHVAFCVIWIGVTLAPVLNARWMAANVLTERYLYLPSVGFCWLIGLALSRAWDYVPGHQASARSVRWALAAGGAVLVIFSLHNIWQRNRIWHDDLTLYTQTLKTDPDSYVMHLNLGTTYFELRDFSKAEIEFDRARELRPDSPNVLNALGCLYLERGRLEDATQVLQRAIGLKPDWTDPHFNYGRVLRKLGKPDHALAEFRTAVRVGPLNASAHFSLAEELASQGYLREAESEYRKSIELSPTLQAQKELVAVLLKTGQEDAAMDVLRDVLVAYPVDSEAHLKMAQLLEKNGKLGDAKQHFLATLQSDPRNAEAEQALKRLASN